MQPTLCSKCKKNVAVVFISRMNEKNEMVNEGLCLQCAAKLGLPQVEAQTKRLGIPPEVLESLSPEMMQAFGGAEEMNDLPEGGEEDDEESGKTATFPFLNRLFGNNNQPAPQSQQPADSGQQPAGRKTEKKRKFLDNYCINLSQRARDGKLDAVIGRGQEIARGGQGRSRPDPKAGPYPGRVTGHRFHHGQRVPQAHRKGHRAGAPLPARHRQRAQHRGYAEDIAGHRPLLRAVPRRDHSPGGAASSGAAV